MAALQIVRSGSALAPKAEVKKNLKSLVKSILEDSGQQVAARLTGVKTKSKKDGSDLLD